MTAIIPNEPPDSGRPAPPANPLPCQTSDPELFFSESPRDLEAAKALCHECPVRAECLAGAVDRSEPWGVWGGEILIGGEIVVHKRARGRPPKTAGPPIGGPSIDRSSGRRTRSTDGAGHYAYLA